MSSKLKNILVSEGMVKKEAGGQALGDFLSDWFDTIQDKLSKKVQLTGTSSHSPNNMRYEFNLNGKDVWVVLDLERTNYRSGGGLELTTGVGKISSPLWNSDIYPHAPVFRIVDYIMEAVTHISS